MGQSYRIKTDIGVNKTINVGLEQDFEFLEILSLKIRQSEVFTRDCANYGVLVGRVTANNGFGVPNARISVFIPIEPVDESNPIISSIYPYKSPTDKNEDGYRYNLLPYEKSYSTHSATGTLPSRLDALIDSTAVEIYDKYYKFTAKTNDSGDYMIMGVPLGTQTIVMDVDLSDIGEFSLTPQDLIRMGLATENQVAGSKFRTSNDLNSLPQIVNLIKSVDISPLWGDPDVCQIAVNRLDFDLRDDANINIQPTSVFMGSVFSSTDKFRVRRNCKPKDDMGNLCSLISGPGQILAIRQTIQQDSEGNPVLEVYQLEQDGNVIDGNGTWLTELPMNLDYLVTNQFGEKVISNDPTIGIPTRAKYRFKIKWEQPAALTTQTRRPNYLVPNIKEYGGPNDTKRLESSYYFGLAWSGYTNGFTGSQKTNRLNEAIDCEDTFYEFKFNRVYTVAGLIDQYKKGAKGRFIGIKEIDNDDCSSSVNKFPVNDGFRNFDILFFVFSILFTIIQPIGISVLIIGHILIWLYNAVIGAICSICNVRILRGRPFAFICRKFGIKCDKKDYTIRLPMITYPDCQACECSSDIKTSSALNNTTASGSLTYLSYPLSYSDKLVDYFSSSSIYSANTDSFVIAFSEALAGQNTIPSINKPDIYKLPFSQSVNLINDDMDYFSYASSKSLPLGERVNIFNQRKNYFSGKNKIKVTFAKNSNIGKFHYDNTLTLLSNTQFNSGDLLTFINISGTTDLNYLYVDGNQTGISGTSYNGLGETTINVRYANTQTTDSLVVYNLPYGSTETNNKFPADIEYFQVVTALTVSDAAKIWNANNLQSFPNIFNSNTIVDFWVDLSYSGNYSKDLKASDFFSDFDNQYVLILQRGVDPYSPKYVNEYSLGNIFGTNDSDSNWTFTAETRINIPIQKLTSTNTTIQGYGNQNDIFYQSYFFSPGIDGSSVNGLKFTGYTTKNTSYYGLLSSEIIPGYGTKNGGEIVSKTSNGFYSNDQDSGFYDFSEDLSGAGLMGCINYNKGGFISYPIQDSFKYYYYTESIFSNPNNSIIIDTARLNVLRTDRLPTSDGLDGGSWYINPSLLQQNNNFAIYLINTDSEDISSSTFTTGSDIVTPDIEGLTNSINVLESFNCESMVGLKCYKGFGTNFEINQECTENDPVEKGCYLFVRNPLKDLGKDIVSFGEWGFRFRFFYGLCRGVLSQSFMNNWINGGLYMFPIQVDTRYDKKNKPSSYYCEDLIHFNSETNNFYYRSSPFSTATKKFVGIEGPEKSVNVRNLLFPTTIINLGMKYNFYKEISFDQTTNGYVMKDLDATSYGDVSDLVNLFVISRITDEGFLQQIFSSGNNSLNQLFSRNNVSLFNQARRIDGDLAQLMSINSEDGVIKFSPEFYETVPGSTTDPTNILGTSSNPTIAVWFSSTTENLQFKDYLTPGRINFRGNDNAGYYPYPYGIKSQIVPFYQWKLNNPTTIFGDQYNNWATGSLDIVQNQRYQSLDRTSVTKPSYFKSSSSPDSNDLYSRGYIFSVDVNGNYSTTGVSSDKFIVGAPFHFYFGIVKGESALDKFKSKYSINE
jgi:hypothetical protein